MLVHTKQPKKIVQSRILITVNKKMVSCDSNESSLRSRKEAVTMNASVLLKNVRMIQPR